MIRFDTKKDMEHYDNLYHQIYVKDKEIDRLNNIIDKAIKFIWEHDLYHPTNEVKLLNILKGEDE